MALTQMRGRMETALLRAIGLMSGTSLDGVDAAILESDGLGVQSLGETFHLPYPPGLRAELRALLTAARALPSAGPLPPGCGQAGTQITKVHALAVAGLLSKAGLRPGDIDVIGFHGQTILHRPDRRQTVQIGSGASLAQQTGIDTVSDFRSADVHAGGEGAPLVPLYHAALARQAGAALPIMVVNIGGVANVTYLGADGSVVAFDTGPGNALIDDWAERHTGQPVDKDGALARKGRVDEGRVAAALSHPFFARSAPKSLDRLAFSLALAEGLAPADGAATLTAFTAAALAQAGMLTGEPPKLWVVCGGGRHNPVLMEALRGRINAPVVSAEEKGWRGDFVEAEAFGYLAIRALKGLPLSLPTTTGVPRPMTGGVLHRAPRSSFSEGG